MDNDNNANDFWKIKNGELICCPNEDIIVLPENVKFANTKAFPLMTTQIIFPENFELLTGDYLDARKMEFTGSNFTIDYGNEEETGVSFVGLKHLTINDDLDLDKAFGKQTEDDIFKLEKLNIKVTDKPHPNFYQNLKKYFDLENIQKITLSNVIDEWNWKYISSLVYFLRKLGIPLEKIYYDYRNFANYGIECEIDENIQKIDLGETPTYYNTIVLNKSLEEIKGKTIWAYNVRFLGDKVIIRDDLTFLDVTNITLNDEIDLSKTFCMLSQKIKVSGEMQIHCRAHKNKKFYLNLKKYFDLSTLKYLCFFDIEKTGYSYPEFLNLLKVSGFPIDKVKFFVTPTNNRILHMEYSSFLNYKGSQKELHIPEGIKTIPTYALFDTSIEYLYLPHTIESIGYLPSSLKKLFIADEGNIPRIYFLNQDIWIKLTDRTINAKNLNEFQFSILQNAHLKKLEIDIYDSLDYLIKIFKEMSNLTIYFNTLIINSSKPLNLFDKIKFKKVITKYLSKKIVIKFNIVPELNNKIEEDFKEDLKEEITLNEFVDEEIQELLNKIKERKKYLSEESKDKLTLECDNLIKRYYQDLKSNEPSLKNSLENELSFGKMNPRDLKCNLLINLHDLVSTFFHQDYEQLITKIREYQKILETNPHVLIEEPNEENKVSNIIFIANYFNCLTFKEMLNNILENNLKKAQEIISQDTLEEPIELSLEPIGNLNLKLFNDIDNLWQKANNYQEKNKEKKELLEDLNLSTDRDFSKELKQLKEKISHLDNANKLLDLFNKTLMMYQEYLKNLLNNIDLEENLDMEEFKSMVRYALSPLNFYYISMQKTSLEYTDIEKYLQEALKTLNDNNKANFNILVSMIIELKEKAKVLDEDNKNIFFKKIEDVLNKWLNILILKDYDYFDSLKKESQEKGLIMNISQLYILFCIMKDLIDISFALDSYLATKQEYQKAMLLRTNS